MLFKKYTITRLQTLFKILHHAMHLTSYITISPQQEILIHYIIPCSSTLAYQQSFYSRAINEWNQLPIEMDHFDVFTTNLQTLLYTHQLTH